jgi:lipoate-protein ligase A
VESPTWRIIKSGFAGAARNMAVDEAILAAHAAGEAPPTIRFYGWKPAAVSIGYFQSMEKEVDLDACRRLGLGWVRRPTGGRAVLHDVELTYSVVISLSILPGTVLETYRTLSAGLLCGLDLLGLAGEMSTADPKDYAKEQEGSTEGGSTAACFDAPSWYELLVDGRKVAGSAQTRRDDTLLQHGSIMLRFDPALMTRVLRLGSEEARSRVTAMLATRAAGLSELTGREISFGEAQDAMTLGFSRGLGIEVAEGSLTAGEVRMAAALTRDKYGSAAWTYRR